MTDKSNFEHLAELSSEQKRALLAQMLREQADGRRTFHPLSYGQQALWFLYQLAPQSSAYHIILAARILSQIDTEAMRHAFQMLIERHPILRCTFTSHADGPVQQVQEDLEIDFEVLESADWDQDRLDGYLDEECHRPFDLENGPVFRAKVLSRSAQEHILLLVAHHIVLDGRSFSILLADLRELYRAAKTHTTAIAAACGSAILGLRALATPNAGWSGGRKASALLAEATRRRAACAPTAGGSASTAAPAVSWSFGVLYPAHRTHPRAL